MEILFAIIIAVSSLATSSVTPNKAKDGNSDSRNIEFESIK